MNLEQLQTMSDNELNELSAVKVMGWEKVESELCDYAIYETGKGYHKDHNWNPTTDMNDAIELANKYGAWQLTRMRILYSAIVGKNYCLANDESPSRAITIASILAKEEQK